MKLLKFKFKDNKGFSIVEMMVATALFFIVSFSLLFFLTDVFKNQKKIEGELENSTDQYLGERYLEKDLMYSSASLYGWKLSDDNQNNFFDLISDYPENKINNKTRSIKLDSEGEEFVFIADRPLMGSPLLYNPASAYTVGASQNINTTSAPLTFDSLNKENVVTKQRSDFLKDGNLILIDFPISIRPKSAVFNGELNMQIPPRFPTFLGYVNGGSVDKATQLSSYFNFRNPYTGLEITSLDQFFRTLPSASGGSPFVKIRVVQAVKYFLKKNPDNKDEFVLYRSVFEAGSFQKPQVVSNKVKSLELFRQSIASLVISFNLVK